MFGLTNADLFFVVVVIITLAWIGYGIWGGRRIELKGYLPARFIAILMFGSIFGYAIYSQREGLTIEIPLCIAMGVCMVLYLFTKTGLTQKGFVFNGRLVGYEEMDFFSFAYEDERSMRLRIGTGRKEYLAAFRPHQKDQIMAYFANTNVTFFQEKGRAK